MYLFNRITVNPQLPKRIEKLSEISYNLWWSWNTEFLKLFKQMDIDLWEKVSKNPVKFLKLVTQEKLEEAVQNAEFLKQYDKVVENFENYRKSKNTWFAKKYGNNRNDLIAYFSAEYGLDQILAIYSGGLGVLSGDHLKSASDLGIPLVGVGLLYQNGYFHQKINGHGVQETEYYDIEVEHLPLTRVKDYEGRDLLVSLSLPKRQLYLKAWQVNVGRNQLYLLDSDIEENHPEYRPITKTLYGGDQEMRIQQEIVLGQGGVALLRALGLTPTVYHMNEGHSSFLILELIYSLMKEKKISFQMARDIVSSQTVFTTHTPVPAGNDIFPLSLVEKYFKGFWDKLGITKQEFFQMGMKPEEPLDNGFNMGILALKVAGKKNGVSKLHGAVSRELFKEIWPNITPNESPITHITNGIHTCSWLAPTLKQLYNQYLIPYWQDRIYEQEVWKKIADIPNQELWKVHQERKRKTLAIVRENTVSRLRRCGYPYEEIMNIVSCLDPNALTIGFARRFATYKRATLIFRDLERITQILNQQNRKVQIIFAGKAHPADQEGQELIKYIHELSMKPQFKGKVFILENYNIAMSRYLISGVDVWLNTPRRPMEASGTSGQKASINGVINFSILDGWWAEGYNSKNGWMIGSNQEYPDYETQDRVDSQSLYETLENKIIPMYYEKDENGISNRWVQTMKESIISTGSKFSTARMLIDYVEQLYMPLCNLYRTYYTDLEKVAQFNNWKESLAHSWDQIEITQENNINNVTIDAGNSIEVRCHVKLGNIKQENIEAQVYYGKIDDKSVVGDITVIPMELEHVDEENKICTYKAKVSLTNGGNYGYTFRVMPKHEMILEPANLNLIKWITK